MADPNFTFNLPAGAVHSLSGNYNGSRITPRVLERAEAALGEPLPPSLRAWLLQYGDRCILPGGGNFLMLGLFPDADEPSITNGRQHYRDMGWPIDEQFIVLGRDSDGSLFALYTRQSVEDEYPVILIDRENPDSDRPYLLLAHDFAGFVNSYLSFEIWRSATETADEETDHGDQERDMAAMLCQTWNPRIAPETLLDTHDYERYCSRRELDRLVRPAR